MYYWKQLLSVSRLLCPAKSILTQYDQLGTGFVFTQNIARSDDAHLAQIKDLNPSQSTHFSTFSDKRQGCTRG